ncbi:MAG: sugar transferase [Paracoccaceae bacterium]
MFDLLAVLLMAPVVLAVVGIAAAAVAASGGRPIYWQLRVGRRGEVFRCWKLRTMVRGAEVRLAALLAADEALAAEWRVNQKLAKDPRITRIGRFLRRTSLDELPQLWNVAMGQMSLIGPRPFTPEQAMTYEAGAGSSAYYRLRPGVTGLWQVSRRNAGTFAERVQWDRAYAERLSFAGDLAILLRTVGVVLKATGQ